MKVDSDPEVPLRGRFYAVAAHRQGLGAVV